MRKVADAAQSLRHHLERDRNRTLAQTFLPMKSADDVLRAALELVEAHLETGQPAEPLLALIAGVQVQIPEDELRAACRRAMLVLAAGGDPHREPDLDSPAVQVLAGDLDTPERRRGLQQGLHDMRESLDGLPLTAALGGRLESDPDLAWRSFALALLADELGDESDE